LQPSFVIGEDVGRAGPDFGWDEMAILDAFNAKQQRVAAEVLEDDPVAQALKRLIDEIPSRRWKGTATDLLATVSRKATQDELSSKAWPQRANWLTNRLRRLAPLMRREWRPEVDPDRWDGRSRSVVIEMLDEPLQ